RGPARIPRPGQGDRHPGERRGRRGEEPAGVDNPCAGTRAAGTRSRLANPGRVMSNVWDEVPDWGGVGARRLDRPSGCALGASVWELQPGGENWYHLRHGSEEMVGVRRGTPTRWTAVGESLVTEVGGVRCAVASRRLW